MVESNHRSNPEKLRAQADDPLAELARFFGQSAPTNRSGQDRIPIARESYPAPDEVLHEPSDKQYLAADEDRFDQGFEQSHDTADDGRYEPSIRANPPPPVRSARFDDEPDFESAAARETPYEFHDSVRRESDEGAYREAAEASSDARGSHYRYDEYDNEPYDHADDHAYGEEYEEYTEGLDTRRRSGLIFAAMIFGLAVLGTAGAFAYRAMFGGPMLPTLPPIIKAESGPNKIISGDANSSADTSRQEDANTESAASGERLVLPSPANPASRPVSTVPISPPDPPPAGGPGTVAGFPALAPSSNPASSQPPTTIRADNPSAWPTAVTSAVSPASSTASPSVPLAAASGPQPTPAVPGAPSPKKIHTVSIHTDQPNAADATTGSATRTAAQMHDANEPPSIVPASTESSATTTRPRTVPAQPVPLNKPLANETASAAPAAPAGGYTVQVSSHRREEEAQSSFRDLQAKYPRLLGGRTPIIRRADLGAKGIYYRAMVGPFASADQATKLCSNLKAAGGSCLVQKN